MSALSISTGLIATIGVAFLCLMPVPNDNIFGSFDSTYSTHEIRANLKSLDLDIVSMDENLNHVVVANPKGDASSRLKKAGAHFVLKAKFAQFCSDLTPSSSSQKRSF